MVYASLDQTHHHVGEYNNHAGYSDINDNKEKSRIEGGNGEFLDKPTATIQDVVADIWVMPVLFPQQQEEEEDQDSSTICTHEDECDNKEWTSVFQSGNNGLILCGMAGAALNLFRETADSLLYLAQKV